MSSPRPEEKDKEKEKKEEKKPENIQDQVKNTITTIYQNRDLYSKGTDRDKVQPFDDMRFDGSSFGKRYDEIKNKLEAAGQGNPVVERACANLKEAMEFAYKAVLSGQTWQNSYAERALNKAIQDANKELLGLKDKDGKDLKIEEKVIADKQFEELKKIIEDKKNLEYKNALDALSKKEYEYSFFIEADADAQSDKNTLNAASATGEVKLPPNMSYKKHFKDGKNSLYSIHTDDKGGVYFTVPAPASLKSVAAAWEETLEFMRTQARATSIEIDLPNCKEGGGYNAARMDVDFFKKTLQAAFDKGFHVTLSSGVLTMLREKGSTVERDVHLFVAQRNKPINDKIEEAKKTANTELVKAAEAAAISHEKRITDSIKSYADDLKSINVSRKPIEILSSKDELERKDEKKHTTAPDEKFVWSLKPEDVKSAFERINKLSSLLDKVDSQRIKLEGDYSITDAKDTDQQKRLETRAKELEVLRGDVVKAIESERGILKNVESMGALVGNGVKDKSVDETKKDITANLDKLSKGCESLKSNIMNANGKLALDVPAEVKHTGSAPTSKM